MSDHILEVEHLKKSYVKDHPILDDISFAINKGEVVVVLGPSGCGKSTFLRCLNQLESIDEGVIKLNNVSFTEEKKQHKICITIKTKHLCSHSISCALSFLVFFFLDNYSIYLFIFVKNKN